MLVMIILTFLMSLKMIILRDSLDGFMKKYGVPKGVKVTIPVFQGRLNPNAYLEQER